MCMVDSNEYTIFCRYALVLAQYSSNYIQNVVSCVNGTTITDSKIVSIIIMLLLLAMYC